MEIVLNALEKEANDGKYVSKTMAQGTHTHIHRNWIPVHRMSATCERVLGIVSEQNERHLHKPIDQIM